MGRVKWAKKIDQKEGKNQEETSKVPPLTLEFHVRDLVRLVSGHFPAVADDEVDVGVLLVVIAAGSVPRLVVHGHANNFGLEPPAAPRRSQRPKLPGLAITRGCEITKVKALCNVPRGTFAHVNNVFHLCRGLQRQARPPPNISSSAQHFATLHLIKYKNVLFAPGHVSHWLHVFHYFLLVA